VAMLQALDVGVEVLVPGIGAVGVKVVHHDQRCKLVTSERVD
jgi:hypothetical protein